MASFSVMVGAIHKRGESLGAEQTQVSSWRRRTEERSRLSEEQTQMDFMSTFLSEGY